VKWVVVVVNSWQMSVCVISSGLRTLCLAVADIDPKFYATWNQQYQLASSSVENREQLVEQAAERIEKVRFSLTHEPLLTACH